MIARDLAPRLRKAAREHPTVTLTGPRQSGKSTLCLSLFPKLPYVNLEAPDVRAYASEDPRGFLADHPRGAVLDEVQRVPELPSYLQGIIDADPRPGRWILTGSQNLTLLESVSQSLAGRTALLHLLPLARSEVLRFSRHPETLEETILHGGYPRIFDRGLAPSDWLSSYVGTYVERDVRTISNVGDLTTFQRFVELCAGRTGQLLNYAALASDAGISQPTAKAWVSVLETSFLAFRLPAYHTNLRKRLVKMPRLYFHDTGLACWLVGIRTAAELRSHPLRGAFFETWVVSEIFKHRANFAEIGGLSFYRDRDGAEVDLVLQRGGRRVLVEAKSAQTAGRNLFDGVRRVQARLSGDSIPSESIVVYGGTLAQRRTEGRLVPWVALHQMPWNP